MNPTLMTDRINKSMEKKTIKITITGNNASLTVETEDTRGRKKTEPGMSGQRNNDINNSLARVINASKQNDYTVLVNGINAEDLEILMEPEDRPVNSLGDKFLNWLKTYDIPRRQAKADRSKKKV